jgi:cytosine/adenosine deaminase-related metal-dependent hydrolase
MKRILIENAHVLVTMDEQRREIEQGALLIEGSAIRRVDESARLRRWMDGQGLRVDETIDASGCVLLPGLVNCHHHLYQTLTRAIGTGAGLSLFDWLKTLYPIWAEMDPECVHVSARLGLTELLLSGATTVADHLYLFPNGSRLDDEIAAAAEVGIRFHPTRGSMSLGESQGGLPPDRICDSEPVILEDSLRVIQQFHDPEPFSMCRVGLAPCSPFSVTAELMRQSADLARAHPGVRLHTHLAETLDEERFCLERFGMRPLEYMEHLGWLGDDVWFAHMVHPNGDEIAQLAHTHTGVCHCPSSNMILASGIMPLREMVDRGVRVGLGVDGSASNDGNHLLGEARQAMLLQRVGWPGFESRADRFSAREALELATLGGARVLGRDDIGALKPGMAADVVAFRIDDLPHAGALGDPVAALLTCAPGPVWLSVINGVPRVRDGALLQGGVDALIIEHNRLADGLLQKAGYKR